MHTIVAVVLGMRNKYSNLCPPFPYAWLSCNFNLFQSQKIIYIESRVHPRTGQEVPEGTLVLDGGGWSTPRPVRFTPGKTCYPLCRRMGGPQGWSGHLWKILPPHLGIRSLNHPVCSELLYGLSYPSPHCLYKQCVTISDALFFDLSSSCFSHLEIL